MHTLLSITLVLVRVPAALELGFKVTKYGDYVGLYNRDYMALYIGIMENEMETRV